MRMQTRGMCTHQWLDGATRTVAAWSALHGTPPSAITPKLGPLSNVTQVALAAALAAAATVNELVVALAGEGACGARSGRGDGGGAIGPGSGRAT